MNGTDDDYTKIVLDTIRVCARYKPKFGQGSKGEGLTLEQFQELYREDAFHSWFGLSNPLLYAAHKAAGGMTSVYRQIGIGCEKLFRRVVMDSLELSEEDVTWSYRVALPSGRKRTLYLDGRVPLEKIGSKGKRDRFHGWMNDSAKMLDVDRKVFQSLTGTVFEIRQGYKSKDSKRQNADITNAARAIVKSGVRGVVHAAALRSSMTSMPSLNRTPSMTLARCRKPRSRRQDFSAHRPIL